MKLTTHLRKALAVMLAALLAGSSVAYADETASEQAVRAALLFNFLKFTEWPVELATDTHLNICVASNDADLIAALEGLNARKLRDKTLLVSRYRQQSHCEVIYVDSRQRWQLIIEKAGTPQALTVSDYRGFAAEGGMIEIAMQDGKTRFDINQKEAKRAGLRFYPQLLKLARSVLE